MRLKLAHGLAIRESHINGRGCFATIHFARGRKIAEYTGERISDREAKRRAGGRAKLRICDIDGRWSLDGSHGGNGTHYINHSCEPNSYMRSSTGTSLLRPARYTPRRRVTLIKLTQCIRSEALPRGAVPVAGTIIKEIETR